MNGTTCSKYLIIEYFDDEYSDNTSKHYVMYTDKALMTHASAVDELSRLCKEHIHTKFAIYKIYEY